MKIRIKVVFEKKAKWFRYIYNLLNFIMNIYTYMW